MAPAPRGSDSPHRVVAHGLGARPSPPAQRGGFGLRGVRGGTALIPSTLLYIVTLGRGGCRGCRLHFFLFYYYFLNPSHISPHPIALGLLFSVPVCCFFCFDSFFFFPIPPTPQHFILQQQRNLSSVGRCRAASSPRPLGTQSSAGCEHCWCRSCCAPVSSSLVQRGLAWKVLFVPFSFLLAHIPLTWFLALGIQVCRACALQKHSACLLRSGCICSPPLNVTPPKRTLIMLVSLLAPVAAPSRRCTPPSSPPAAGIGAGTRGWHRLWPCHTLPFSCFIFEGR